MSNGLKYDARGVSADKSEVHDAIKHLDKGVFPNAFCKILPDIAAGDSEFCNIMHADTAGTKTSLAYLYWKETGDLSVWKGVIQDALVMNLDDLICVGATDDIIMSSTIGRNKHLIPGEVVSALIGATSEFIDDMQKWGIGMTLAGGETADVGDIVRTLDVGFTAFVRLPRAKVVDMQVQPGDVIVGLASFGQASYETEYNGGMGSNGLTSARHDVLNHELANRYPESFDPNTPKELVYAGGKSLTELESTTQIPVGKLILSPTRTYAPVIAAMLKEHRGNINGIVHCSGGAQTKVMKFVQNRHLIKDQLFDTPPLFQMIQQESGTDWREMYQVFNMGHRMELFVPEAYADDLIQISKGFGVDAKVIGRVEEAEENRLTLKSPYGTYTY